MRRSRVRSPSAPFPEQAKAAAGRRSLLFCFLVALCEGLDLQAAGVAAGGLSREFMPTAGQKGLFFSASTFGLSIGAVIGGWLADRIGRKKVLIAAIGAFGLFSLLTIFAWDMHRSEEHTSELQSRLHAVCRPLRENTRKAAARSPRSSARLQEARRGSRAPAQVGGAAASPATAPLFPPPAVARPARTRARPPGGAG